MVMNIPLKQNPMKKDSHYLFSFYESEGIVEELLAKYRVKNQRPKAMMEELSVV